MQLDELRKKAAHVRLKPGMYLGSSGTPAVVRATGEVLDTIIGLAPRTYPGPVTTDIREEGRIEIQFADLALPEFSPAMIESWTRALWQPPLHSLGIAIGYSDRFTIECSDGYANAVWSFDGTELKTHRSDRHDAPYLSISWVPVNDFGSALTDNELFQLGGRLKKLSALRPGLGMRLAFYRWKHELRYYYGRGLPDLLFEGDYARHSLHPGFLSFKGEMESIRVEGYLRFLHAGTPTLHNWVNFHPTQGGAHLEGLGEALVELLPDATRGCRPVLFITNSNNGAGVQLPHSFIGALTVELKDPRYEGPTKDILLGDDVRKAVYSVARQCLPAQWKGFCAS